MKKYLISIVITTLLILPVKSKTNKVRIAVLPFQNINLDKNYDWLSLGFSETLTSSFAQTGNVVVVERNQLNRVIKEQTFQKSGFVNRKNAVELGKILGVNKLVIGSYQIYNKNIKVNSRIIDVTTGEVDNGSSISKVDQLNNIFNLQEEISIKSSQIFNNEFKQEDKKKIASVSKNTKSLSAYEYYIKGKQYYFLYNPTGYQKSIETYHKALEIDKNYSLALSGLAHSYAKLGYHRKINGQSYQEYFDKAINYGNKSVEISPNLSEAYRSLSLAYLKFGYNEQAKVNIEKAIKINDQDAENFIIQWKLSERDPESPIIKKALELNPNSAIGHLELGNAYYERKEYFKAIDEYNKTNNLKPSFGYAFMMLGNVYLETQKYGLAIKNYKKSLESDPNLINSYINLSNIYLALGDNNNAIQVYKDALKIDTKSVYAYNNLALIYSNTNDLKNALENINKSLEINPFYTDAINNRANVYFKKNDFDLAINDYEKLIKINPQIAENYNNLARVLIEKGDMKSALIQYNKACNLGDNESCNFLKSES